MENRSEGMEELAKAHVARFLELADAENWPELERSLRDTKWGLSRESPEKQISSAAAKGLAIRMLIQKALASEKWQHRTMACMVLEAAPGKAISEIAPVLRETLYLRFLRDTSPAVRAWALYAISNVGPGKHRQAVLSHLRAAAEKHPEYPAVHRALKRLGEQTLETGVATREELLRMIARERRKKAQPAEKKGARTRKRTR